MTHTATGAIRVLYVDDSSFDRALVRDVLVVESSGFVLTEVATRAELEALLATGEIFDLVLSDFNILGMTGLDVVDLVREAMPGLPIIIVTGTGSEEIAVKALKAGADDYVIKQPNHIRRLPKTIHAVLEARAARDERDRARALLEESEFRFRLLAEHSSDLILRLDSRGTILYASPASEEIIGGEPGSLLGMPFHELVHHEDRHLVQAAVTRAGDSASVEYGELDVPPFRFEPRDSEPRWVEARGRVVPAGHTLSGDCEIQLASRDVTDRRRMEETIQVSREKLRQLRHLESIGRLAGGIAHDFNNLLTVISGNLEIIRGGLDEDHTLRSEVDEIDRAAGRAGELTRHLLQFSSGGVSPLSEVDLRELLDEAETMLRRTLGPTIRLEVTAPRELPPVRSNAATLQQVLINLGMNARDAIHARGSGGTVRIEVDRWDPNGSQIPSDLEALDDPRLAPWLPGRGTLPLIRIRVIDDGCGMAPEVADRVFEPFFTTKEFGKGTGLGLASSFGTVRQAGGTILVDSVPNEGTTFTVLIPVRTTPG